MEIETDEFHALQKQICDLQDCCEEWEKQALDYKAENITLLGDLERTRKALDIAVDALTRCSSMRGVELIETINAALAKIKDTIETKGDDNE